LHNAHALEIVNNSCLLLVAQFAFINHNKCFSFHSFPFPRKQQQGMQPQMRPMGAPPMAGMMPMAAGGPPMQQLNQQQMPQATANNNIQLDPFGA